MILDIIRQWKQDGQYAYNDGGTSGSPSGHAYGFNTNLRLINGATFWDQIVGGEYDIAMTTGASVADVIGMQIVQLSNHAVAGSRSNVGFTIANPSSRSPATSGKKLCT